VWSVRGVLPFPAGDGLHAPQALQPDQGRPEGRGFKRQYHLGLHFLLHMQGPLPQGDRYSRVMHELQFYYLRSGFKAHSRASFQQAFWQELRERGRIGEASVMLRCWIREGGLTGALLKSLEMKGTGLGLLRRGRLRLIPKKIDGLTGFNKIIDKALAQGGIR